ncbi:hypothetical protein WJX79_007380 [Trebouxia sp. C0005]
MISSPIKLRRSARVAGRSAASTFQASTTPAALHPLPAVPSQQHIRANPFPEAGCIALASHLSSKPAPGFPSRTLEEQLWAKGFKRIAGVDEAGRGPLAGPVVAGACIMPPHVDIPGIRDSKLMTAAQRENICQLLMAHPEVICASCVVDVAAIDQMNILQAALRAMEGAVAALPCSPPDYLLVDGNQVPGAFSKESSQPIVRGDSKSTVIAAASILAKVTRDKLMDQYHERWPQYNFAQHKGYGTAAHMAVLKQLGACPIHRRTFAPLKHWIAAGEVAFVDIAQTLT